MWREQLFKAFFGQSHHGGAGINSFNFGPGQGFNRGRSEDAMQHCVFVGRGRGAPEGRHSEPTPPSPSRATERV